VNVDLGTWVTSPNDFRFIPGVPEALGRLRRRSRAKLAIVTNQSCIGRGMITTDTLGEIHRKMTVGVEANGGRIDSIHVAPDNPEQASERRKPGPGMLLEAMSEHAVARKDKVVMIGDTASDMLAASNAGVSERILLCTGHGAERGETIDALGIELPVWIEEADERLGIKGEMAPLWICRDLPSAIDELILSDDDESLSKSKKVK